MTRGIKRSQSQGNNIRLPITLEVLKKLRGSWLETFDGDSSHDMWLLWAIACTAFFGFMRLGEIFSRKGEAPLKVSDLATDSHDNPSFFRILIRRAKNDPFGKGSFVFLGKSNKNICPVLALSRYLTLRPPVDKELFLKADGSPCSRDFFVSSVRNALARAGLNQSLFAGHSFRIGAATTAAAAGIPSHTIKRLGRWNSEAFNLYIRQSDISLCNISAIMASTPC
ncbi:MAG: hypothetical protein ISN29_07860 [Gammaproteobacteria bacterium AqS3]|nr:hypothetical protein [Gammaproteobacteria bacterium AqS3]